MPGKKYNNKTDLLIEPEVARDLLSKSIARTFKQGEVNVARYDAERLSYYHGKSVVHKVRLTFDFPESADIFPVPPVVVVKTYSQSPQNIKEYEAERTMLELADDLTCRDGDRTVRVYPTYFGREVPECSPHLTLIREYVTQDSLMKIVLDKKGRNEDVRWTDINGTISPIALLHTNSPWIERRLPPEVTRFSKEYLSSNLVKHIEKIVLFSGNEFGKEMKERFVNNLDFVMGRYLFGKDLSSVINGDLSVCPHHTTNSSLLDAGGTCIGPITDDLSLYSDPIFEGVLDQNGRPMDLETRGRAAVKEYIERRKRFAEILHYPNNVEERLQRDFLLASFLVSGIRGNIRGASSALTYKYNFAANSNNGETPISWTPKLRVPTLGQPTNIPLQYLEQEVNHYMHNVLKIVRVLRPENTQLFGALESLIRQALPENFKINHSTARRLINRITEKVSPNNAGHPIINRDADGFKSKRRLTQPIKPIKPIKPITGLSD
ncbi:hypothetical protein A3K73_06280 [Candidatus Pacearchaeota archaeon RBG_13_36_9]|nr:MAG: hypothetical protein A3K73_06280 [Candidatus Pacearchaeota archaeon RBG_13_36_9]